MQPKALTNHNLPEPVVVQLKSTKEPIIEIRTNVTQCPFGWA